MTDTCEALVSTGAWQAEWRRLPLPADLAGGGLGRVLAAGICGSDVPIAAGTLRGDLFPLVMGHENVVRVESADDLLCDRWGVSPGDRVLVEEFVPCGACPQCRSGRYNLCAHTDYNSPTFVRYGRTPISVEPSLWGGFAGTLYLHPRAALHRVPEALADTTAVLAVPLANGLRWVGSAGGARPGEPVVVLGPGAHGLGCVLAARRLGAAPVILVGLRRDELRLKTGQRLGADIVLCSDADDVIGSVREATGGQMAPLVVDVTGSAPGCALAAELAGVGGRVVVAGATTGGEAAVPAAAVTRRELQVQGVRGHDGRALSAAVDLLAGGLVPASVQVTTLIDMGQVYEALQEMAHGASGCPPHFAVAGIQTR